MSCTILDFRHDFQTGGFRSYPTSLKWGIQYFLLYFLPSFIWYSFTSMFFLFICIPTLVLLNAFFLSTSLYIYLHLFESIFIPSLTHIFILSFLSCILCLFLYFSHFSFSCSRSFSYVLFFFFSISLSLFQYFPISL